MSFTNRGNSNAPLTGVGGWLGLFIVGFGLVTPVTIIVQLVDLFSDSEGAAAGYETAWTIYRAFALILNVAVLGVIGFTVWRLFNVKNPKTVRFTIIAILFATIVSSLLDIGAVMLLFDIPLREMPEEVWVQLARALVYSAIWCVYFLVSKRVKNTYYGGAAGGDDAQAKVFE